MTRDPPHFLAKVDNRRRCHLWHQRERRQQNEVVASTVFELCIFDVVTGYDGIHIAVGPSFVKVVDR